MAPCAPRGTPSTRCTCRRAASSYWSYLGTACPAGAKSEQQQRLPDDADRNTCLVLPILKWLLGELERGILAIIHCEATNSLKKVIRRGRSPQSEHQLSVSV